MARREAPTSKFIPTTPWNGQQGLSQFAARGGLRTTDCGSGKQRQHRTTVRRPETGLGTWIPVIDRAERRISELQAATLKLTGYYRPEDFEIDPRALAAGSESASARNNTGNESQNHNWGQTICVTDGTIARVGRPTPQSRKSSSSFSAAGTSR